MLRAVSIGRVFGVRLDVHASWLLVFALVTAGLARAAPFAALGGAWAVLFAALAAFGLFAGVVLHEFGHAFAARLFGVRTRSIALFVFGGTATLEGEPPTPRADALVALAGPAASALIAAAAYGLLLGIDAFAPAASAGPLAALCAYAVVANAMLAAFNLLPAYPMDGGRVLRAVLWQLRGDRDAATRKVLLAGIALAACVAAAGATAAVVMRTWEFAWYAAVGAYLLRHCWSLRRAPRAGAEA